MPGMPLSVVISLKQPFERALGRGAVVADDVVDQRVVEHAEIVERVDDAADIVVGLLEEAGIDLHLARQHRFELGGHVVPRRGSPRAGRSARRRSGMTPSFFCRAKISSRSLSQPPSNLPLYLSDHSFGHMVGRMGRAGREVHEERLVRHQRLLLAHPGDGAIGEVLGQRVALLGRLAAARPPSCPRTGPGSTGWPRRRRSRRSTRSPSRSATGGRARRARPPRPAPRGTCRTARSNSR